MVVQSIFSLGTTLAGLSSVPGLQLVFTLAKFCWEQHLELEEYKEQLGTLIACIGTFLQVISQHAREGGTTRSSGEQEHRARMYDSFEFKQFYQLIEEIKTFVVSCRSQTVFKRIIQKSNNLSKISGFHHRLEASAHAFHIAAAVHMQQWQEAIERARQIDQINTEKVLRELGGNDTELLREISKQRDSDSTIQASLVRLLAKRREGSNTVEDTFIRQALDMFLRKEHAELPLTLEEWEVTNLEITQDARVGAGGFGEVYSGEWMGTRVAIKRFRIAHGEPPSPEAVRQEIQIWKELRHNNIIPFWGANVRDGQPFLLMPLCMHGNALQFLSDNPDADRLRILHDIAAGLYYLHSRPTPIIHGDLKAANVLIRDDGSAALSDFGLSRMRADALAASDAGAAAAAAAAGGQTGSLFWKSPERFKGSSLKKPSDIYAFGMTCYEIITRRKPFFDTDPSDVPNAVLQGVRPGLPKPNNNLPHSLLRLIEECWLANPSARPSAEHINSVLTSLAIASGNAWAFPPPHPRPSPWNAMDGSTPLHTGDNSRKAYFVPSHNHHFHHSPTTVSVPSTSSPGSPSSPVVQSDALCLTGFSQLLSMHFIPTTNALVTLLGPQNSRKSQLVCWDTSTGQVRRQEFAQILLPVGTEDFVLSSDGAFLAALTKSSVTIWRLEQSGASASFESRILFAPGHSVKSLAFSVEGDLAAVATAHYIRIFRTANGQPYSPTIETSWQAGLSMAFDPHVKRLFLAQGHSLQTYHLPEVQVHSMQRLPQGIVDLRATTDSKAVVVMLDSSGDQSNAFGHNIKQFACGTDRLEPISASFNDLKRFRGEVKSCTLSPNGQLVAVLYLRQYLAVYKIIGGIEIFRESCVEHVEGWEFSWDSSKFAFLKSRNEIRVISLADSV